MVCGCVILYVLVVLLVLWLCVEKYMEHSVWDLTSLVQELTTRMHGQNEALRELVWTIRNLANETEHTRRHHVVFLMGGPGVGKSHVIDIMINHIHVKKSIKPIRWFGQRGVEPYDFHLCEKSFSNFHTHFENGMKTCGLTLKAVEFNYLDKYINNPEFNDLAGKLNLQSLLAGNIFGNPERTIYVVTGRIFNERIMTSMSSSADYRFYVDAVALQLEKYMLRYASYVNFSFIKFAPMSPALVTRSLQERNVGTPAEIEAIVAANSRLDFVPLGCKAH